MTQRRWVVGWWVMLVLATLVAVLVGRYLTLDPDVFFPEQRDVYVDREALLLTHVVAGMAALLIGPWQYVARVRDRRVGVHRWLGRTYAVAAVVGGAAGLGLATTAYGGVVSSLGFALLGTTWIAATVVGVRAIRRGDVELHRRWMARSYALCFAAVTLRVYLGIAAVAGAPFDVAYPLIAWMCWVPNLLVVLWWQGRRGRAAGPLAA